MGFANVLGNITCSMGEADIIAEYNQLRSTGLLKENKSFEAVIFNPDKLDDAILDTVLRSEAASVRISDTLPTTYRTEMGNLIKRNRDARMELLATFAAYFDKLDLKQKCYISRRPSVFPSEPEHQVFLNCAIDDWVAGKSSNWLLMDELNSLKKAILEDNPDLRVTANLIDYINCLLVEYAVSRNLFELTPNGHREFIPFW
jgi:hypothetical protein